MAEPSVRPEYEGWENYETWAVNLWLSNERVHYDAVRRLVRTSDDPEAAVKDYVEEMVGVDGSGLEIDLLVHALAYVDWESVVKAFKED